MSSGITSQSLLGRLMFTQSKTSLYIPTPQKPQPMTVKCEKASPCLYYTVKENGKLVSESNRLLPLVDLFTRKREGVLTALRAKLQSSKSSQLQAFILQRLPIELLQHIIGYLDHTSLLRLSQTSHQFYHLCRQRDQPWQRLFRHDFRHEQRLANKVLTYYDLYRDHCISKRRMMKGRARMTILNGHTEAVYCVTVFAGYLVSGSRDHTIKVWDMKTGLCINTLEEHEASVLRLRESSTKLVSGSSDATVIIWSTDFTILRRLNGHVGGILDVCIAGKYIVSSARDRTVRVWDENGKVVRQLGSDLGPVNALAAHDNRLVTASGDAGVAIWDLDTGQCLRTFNGPVEALASVSFDGKHIFCGGLDRVLYMWHVDTGEAMEPFVGHKDLIRTISKVNDELIITGSYDKSIRIWDIKSKQCRVVFRDSNPSWVFNVFSSTPFLISCSQNGSINLFDFGHGLPSFS